MNKADLPMISIIIPVRPGGHVRALEAVERLDYPPDRMEVFVAEGSQPSRQRNEAASNSKGDILYFLDDDSRPDPENLKLIAEHFSGPAVAVAGGPSITPGDDTFIQRCFSYLFMSPLGGAGIRNRYQRVGKTRETSESELILCNLGIRAEVYRRLGGLNERLYPNEENELMARIKEEGLKLIHDPDIFVYRSQRKNLKAFIKQILNYGRGRMEQTILYPVSFESIHFIPFAFLIYSVSLFVIYTPLYRIPMLCYIILSLFFSLRAFLDDNKSVPFKFKSFCVLFSLFPLMHLSYGAGMIWGLKRCLSKREGADSKVTLKKV